MEMTSSVMRFALATYFMKRGGLSSVFSAASCPSPSYEPSFTTSQLSDDEEKEIIDSSFSHVVSTHVSNLRELLVEQRFQDWSKGIAELREYVAANNQIDLLVAVLVKMIQRQEEDAVCIVQVIEHMCFEDDGEPSVVFDQTVGFLFEELDRCCEIKETSVAIWLLRAIDGVAHGLRQFHTQRYGAPGGTQHDMHQVFTLEEATAKLIQNSI